MEDDKDNTKNSGIYMIFGVLITILVGGGILLLISTKNKSNGSQVMGAIDSGNDTSKNQDPNGNMIDNSGNSMQAKIINVEGGNYYFSPNEIRVKKGDKVKIVFTNVGGTHNWVIDEFNAKTKLTSTGETDEVEFVADKQGSFEFYCSVGNHRALGMVGTLIVE